MNEEIKEWQTQSVKHKVAYVLMMDGISFRYTEETGIVFSYPQRYEKFFILSFCRGEKVICMAVMGKNRDS